MNYSFLRLNLKATTCDFCVPSAHTSNTLQRCILGTKKNNLRLGGFRISELQLLTCCRMLLHSQTHRRHSTVYLDIFEKSLPVALFQRDPTVLL